MCGIIGGINLPVAFASKFMAHGLYADAVRGWHSTGLVRVDGEDVHYYKRALPAADFINTPVFADLTKGAADAYIGHNRAATVGKVVDETSHPFVHGNIIGVHNGTLDDHKKDLEDGKDFVVDSEALIYNIDKVGIEETVKNAHGAFALVYFDMEDNTLNMIRNEARPLYIARLRTKHRGKPSYVYGSESLLLDWLVDRSTSETIETCWSVPVGEHFSFDMETFDYTTQKMEVAEDVPTYWNYGRTTTYYQGNYGKTTVGKSSGSTVPAGKAVLNAVGVEVDEEVEFFLYKSEHYTNNPTNGTVQGCLAQEPFTEVVIYNVELALCPEGELYQGKVSHGVPAVNNSDNRIAVKKETLIMIEQDETQQSPVIVEHDKPLLLHPPKIVGPDNRYISKDDFDKLAKHGCGWCSRDLDYDNEEFVTWNGNTPICPECTVNDPSTAHFESEKPVLSVVH